jgi:hypothetical protein
MTSPQIGTPSHCFSLATSLSLILVLFHLRLHRRSFWFFFTCDFAHFGFFSLATSLILILILVLFHLQLHRRSFWFFFTCDFTVAHFGWGLSRDRGGSSQSRIIESKICEQTSIIL